MSNMRIRNMFLLVTALAVMFLLACGQSDEEFDARVEAKVTEILANMPDPTPIPEPTPITIPTPLPTATPWGFNMTGWEAVGLVQQFELTRRFGYDNSNDWGVAWDEFMNENNIKTTVSVESLRWKPCLNLVNAIHDDWEFTYNEDKNTWLVEKSVFIPPPVVRNHHGTPIQ